MSDSEFQGSKIYPYIPGVIRQWYSGPSSSENHTATTLEGILICLDASGFTALTKELDSLGKEGPEALTQALNRFFDEMSRAVFAFNGDILKFAGDALWVFLPSDTDVPRLFRAILDQLEIVNNSPELADRTTLRVHMGAEAGRFQMVSLGNHDWRVEAEPMGDLVATVYQACDLGGDNECAVGPSLASQLPQAVPLAAPYETFALVPPAVQSVDLSAVGDGEETLADDIDVTDVARLAKYLPTEIKNRLSDPAAALAEQSEHRQVTVLFAKMEFNSYGPGAVTDINARLARCFDIIRDESGSIARIDPYQAGHKLLVLFGAPVRHGHDELNALACARRMRDQGDDQFHLRIGLATGPLYCGDVGAARRREYTVMGNGINMAARLMSKANDQEVLIDQELRDRLPNEVQTEKLSLALKGMGDDVAAYRFIGLAEVRHDQLKCDEVVGQASEFDQVVSLWPHTQTGQPQVVTITGESGIGKTTFLHRLQQHFKDEPHVTLDGARAVLHGTGWLARQFLTVLADPGASNQERLYPDLANRVEERWHPLLANILAEEAPDNRWTRGLSPELRLAKTGEIFAKLIRDLSTDPHILLIDDFERVDEFSQALIRAMLSTPDLPLLTVITVSPDGPRAADDDCPTPLTNVDLTAPTDSEWQDYFSRTFEPGRRETDLVGRVLEVSDGNPQFVSQFLRQCRDDQTIVNNPISGKWELASTGVPITPPESLTNLNLAALDRLSQTERYLMKCASVALLDFTLSDLRQLANDVPPNQAGEFLEGMVSAGHLVTGSEPNRYHFVRRSMREAVYGCLPESTLRELHARYGEILLAATEDIPDSMLAYHFFRAGRDRQGFDYSYRSARRASDVYSPGEAATYFDQCEQILQRTPSSQLTETVLFQFHHDYAQFLVHEGKHGRAYGIIRRWRHLAKDAQSQHHTTEATINAASVLWQQSQYDRCRMFLKAVLDQPPDDIEAGLLAQTYTYLAQLERRTGDFQSAIAAATRAVDLAQTSSDIPAEVSAHNELGLAHWSAGKLSEAAAAFETCLELSREHESMYDQAKTTNNLAIIYWELGDLLTAERLMSEAVETFRSTGDRRNESYASGNIANLYRIFGQMKQARERFERADLIFERFGDRHAHFYTVGNLGDLDLILGDLEQASDRFDRTLEFACKVGDKELEAECRIRQGEVAFLMADYVQAEALYDQAMELAREVGSSEYLIRGSVGRARLMLKLQRAEDALDNIKTVEDEAAKNDAEISRFEAVFLSGECHRIKGETAAAIQAYRSALEYARRQKVFELALKCATRLSEFDSDCRAEAETTIRELIAEYESANPPHGFEEVMGSVYYSYFAASLDKFRQPSNPVGSHTA